MVLRPKGTSHNDSTRAQSYYSFWSSLGEKYHKPDVPHRYVASTRQSRLHRSVVFEETTRSGLIHVQRLPDVSTWREQHKQRNRDDQVSVSVSVQTVMTGSPVVDPDLQKGRSQLFNKTNTAKWKRMWLQRNKRRVSREPVWRFVWHVVVKGEWTTLMTRSVCKLHTGCVAWYPVSPATTRRARVTSCVPPAWLFRPVLRGKRRGKRTLFARWEHFSTTMRAQATGFVAAQLQKDHSCSSSLHVFGRRWDNHCCCNSPLIEGTAQHQCAAKPSVLLDEGSELNRKYPHGDLAGSEVKKETRPGDARKQDWPQRKQRSCALKLDLIYGWARALANGVSTSSAARPWEAAEVRQDKQLSRQLDKRPVYDCKLPVHETKRSAAVWRKCRALRFGPRSWPQSGRDVLILTEIESACSLWPQVTMRYFPWFLRPEISALFLRTSFRFSGGRKPVPVDIGLILIFAAGSQKVTEIKEIFPRGKRLWGIWHR